MWRINDHRSKSLAKVRFSPSALQEVIITLWTACMWKCNKHGSFSVVALSQTPKQWEARRGNGSTSMSTNSKGAGEVFIAMSGRATVNLGRGIYVFCVPAHLIKLFWLGRSFKAIPPVLLEVRRDNCKALWIITMRFSWTMANDANQSFTHLGHWDGGLSPQIHYGAGFYSNLGRKHHLLYFFYHTVRR